MIHSIMRRKLVHCTDAFSSIFLQSEEIIPLHGQILITKLIKKLKLKGTFFYNEDFYYFRNLGSSILIVEEIRI